MYRRGITAKTLKPTLLCVLSWEISSSTLGSWMNRMFCVGAVGPLDDPSPLDLDLPGGVATGALPEDDEVGSDRLFPPR